MGMVNHYQKFCQCFSLEKIAPLKPQILNPAAIPGKIFEGNEAIEMINPKMLDDLRVFHQAKIHRNSAPAFFIGVFGKPVTHAGAAFAEMEFEVEGSAIIIAGGSRNLDFFSNIAIGPKSAVAAARGAVTGRGAFKRAAKGPLHLAAVTGAF